MKLISYSGYDHMTMFVEESPWWVKLFRLDPRVVRYVGEDKTWFHDGVQVSTKKSAALSFLWKKARQEQAHRLKAARAR